jgi:hypothetical protein
LPVQRKHIVERIEKNRGGKLQPAKAVHVTEKVGFGSHVNLYIILMKKFIFCQSLIIARDMGTSRMSHRVMSSNTQLFHDFQGTIDGLSDLNVLNRHHGLFADSGSLFGLLLCHLYRLHGE